ncbi:MAG: hypothetical protein M0Z94_19685 [Dehalococcoidales bacterium]|nr:hypothetical protein [Dehalococcoidales bacterium]
MKATGSQDNNWAIQVSGPPSALQRATVHFDNPALVPGNLLPFKAQWQKVANGLPAGTVLIILPVASPYSRKTLEEVANLMRAKGRPVAIVTAKRFG